MSESQHKWYVLRAIGGKEKKVSWPTWSELRGSAVVVLVASLIIALLIFGIDVTFRSFMRVIYSFFY